MQSRSRSDIEERKVGRSEREVVIKARRLTYRQQPRRTPRTL